MGFRGALWIACFSLQTAFAAPSTSPKQALRDRLEALCQASSRAQIAVSVVFVETGEVLFSHRPDQLQVPASNVKLLTSFAALTLLTPQYRFRTALYADRIDANHIRNVYLRGFGDPTLVTETLTLLAQDLRATGITTVTRDLIVDDTFFDAERFPPGYSQSEQADEDASYRAPTGAISLNYNTARLWVRPTSVGQPAYVAVDPMSAYLKVMGTVKTIASGPTRVRLRTRARPQRMEFTVSGQMRVGADALEFRRRIEQPDVYTAQSLKEALARYGVRLQGRVRRGITPTRATMVAEHSSSPLGVLVRDLNKVSQNFMAEQILKTLGAERVGAPGSTQKGLQALAECLQKLGIERGQYTLENGSGLGTAARLTARQLTTVLAAAWRDHRIAPDFVASLAVAGADGTLGHRMVGTKAERLVRAKTGTLDGVTALSGYVGPASNRTLAFSVLVSGSTGSEGKRLADAIATELATFVTTEE